jgi:hypothetical protein
MSRVLTVTTPPSGARHLVRFGEIVGEHVRLQPWTIVGFHRFFAV